MLLIGVLAARHNAFLAVLLRARFERLTNQRQEHSRAFGVSHVQGTSAAQR